MTILRQLLHLLSYGGSTALPVGLRASVSDEEQSRMLEGGGTPDFRVLVKRRTDAAWTDLSATAGGNWVTAIRTDGDSPDRPASSFTVEFIRAASGASLAAGMQGSALNRTAEDVFSPLVYAGRQIRVYTSNLAPGQDRADATWHLWLEGTINRATWPDKVTAECSTLDARIMRRQIRDEERRGAAGEGVPIDEEFQGLLDRWFSPGEIPLVVDGLPAFGVGEYLTPKGSLGDFLRTQAQRRGWDLRYRWNDATESFQYTLYLPPRDKQTADITVGPEHIREVPGLEVSDEYVRNAVSHTYYNEAEGQRETRTAINPDSIAEFDEQWMGIEDGDDSDIRTPLQSDVLLAFALHDLAQPPVEKRVKLPFLPFLALHHTMQIRPDNARFDYPLLYSVVGVSHVVEATGRPYTIAHLRGGSPVGQFYGWHKRGRVPIDSSSFYELSGWGETRSADNTRVTRTWRRGSKVAEVWVRTALVEEGASEADGYAAAAAGAPRILPVGADSFTEERPPLNYVRYTQYEPRTADYEVRGKIWKWPLNPLEVLPPSVKVTHVLSEARSAADLTATVYSPGAGERVRVRMRDAGGVEWLSGYYPDGTALEPSTVFTQVDSSSTGTPLASVGLSSNAQTVLLFQAEGQDSEAVSGWQAYPLPKIDRPAVLRFHTTPGNDNLHADLYVTVGASYAQGGTLYLWTAKASTGNANPEGPPDATIAVASTPATLGPDDSPALNEITVWPGRGKVVFGRFVAADGGDTGQQSFTLNSWLDLVGADGQLVPDAMNQPAQWAASFRPFRREATRPAVGLYVGDRVAALDTRRAWEWNGSAWTEIIPSAGTYSYLPFIIANSVTAEEIAAKEIYAYHLNVARVFVSGLTVTGTSWSACTVTFEGNTYNVAAGSSTAEVVTWSPVAPNAFYGLPAGNLEGLGFDQNRGDTIIMVLEGGAYKQVWNGTRIYGGHLTNDAIRTRHLSAGSITADKVQAGAITADKINVTDLSAINPEFTGTVRLVQQEGNAVDFYNGATLALALKSSVNHLGDGTALFDFGGGASLGVYENSGVITVGRVPGVGNSGINHLSGGGMEIFADGDLQIGCAGNLYIVGGNRPNITGSRGGNAALASLLNGLSTLGLITNGTTP